MGEGSKFYNIDHRIRSGWVFGETFNPDLSIVELNREVKFVPDSIAPICLPPSSDFPDRATKENPVKAFVAGWGASR